MHNDQAWLKVPYLERSCPKLRVKVKYFHKGERWPHSLTTGKAIYKDEDKKVGRNDPEKSLYKKFAK